MAAKNRAAATQQGFGFLGDGLLAAKHDEIMP